MTLALTAQRCANGRNQQVWEEGKKLFGGRHRVGAVIPSGQRDRAVYCVSHYLFYGDATEGIDAYGYGREEDRAELMTEWFQGAYQKVVSARQEAANLAHIRRACNWRPKNARGLSEELIDKLAAAKSTPDRFARANLKRQNEARQRILFIYDQLLKESEGEVPSIRAVAKAAKADRRTVRGALEKAGGANNPNPSIHCERARVYNLFCNKEKARAERLRDFRRTKREESALMAKAPATKANKTKNNSSKKPTAAEKKGKNDITVLKPAPQPEPISAKTLQELRLQITYRKLEDLKGYARNAKLHTPEQIELLARSITEYGFIDPIITDGADIIHGHGRRMGAMKAGYTEGPCINISHLSELEKRAFMILVNKSSEYKSGWDNALLSLELQDLKGADFDLGDLGFAQDELNELLGAIAQLPLADLTPEDSIPASPKTPVSKPGDVWLLGAHRICCGDSSNVTDIEKLMPGEERVDVICTDVPYGVKFEQGKFCPTAGKKFRGVKIANDELQGDDLTEFIAGAFRAAATKCTATAVYVWSPALLEGYSIARGLQEAGLHIQSQIVWAKNTFILGRCDYHWQHEGIWYGYFGKNHPWYGGRDKGSIWHVNKMQAMELHPTQKPVELAEIAITNSSKEDNIILDLFGGSGFVLIAAEKLRRRARIMEIDPTYVDTMILRWQAFTGQEAMLEGGNSYNELATAFGV